MERIEQAVILAAGEGQRLKPFTSVKPKVMIPIANKPILRHVIESIARNGIRKVTVVVGYRKEQVIDYFGSGEQFDVRIDYVEQKQQLGTAHALKQAEGKVKGKFLVLSGDNIIEPETVADLIKSEPNCILVKEQENISKYGVVETRDGFAVSIVEKPRESTNKLANIGIYSFNESVFSYLGQETDLTSVIQKMLASGEEVRTCETRQTWLDVVYPWDILKLNSLALAKTAAIAGGSIERGVVIRGRVSIGKGTVIRANSYIVGPAIIGEDCEIGPSVCILPSTSIGDRACVFPFSVITNSVIADGAEIGAGSNIQDTIVDRGSKLKAHFVARSDEADIRIEDEYHRVKIGAIIGEGCTIQDAVVVNPGVIIGNRCRIKALRVLGESIPDESLVV